jgi:hypothetical protein
MSAKELTYFILKCIDCNRIDDFFNSENYNSELDGYIIEGAFVSRVYLEAVKENPENFSHCREKPKTHL